MTGKSESRLVESPATRCGGLGARSRSTAFHRNPALLDVQMDIIHRFVRRCGFARVHVFAESTGQETWSLLFECVHAGIADQVRISASDVCSEAASTARTAEYEGADLANLPERFRRGYLQEAGTRMAVREDLRRKVVHLVCDARDCAAVVGPFDLILCQNLLVHFDRADAYAALAQIRAKQEPGGYVSLGGIPIAPLRPMLAELGYRPVLDSVERIYDGWTLQRRAWKADGQVSPYWALPPFSVSDPAECCSVFVLE